MMVIQTPAGPTFLLEILRAGPKFHSCREWDMSGVRHVPYTAGCNTVNYLRELGILGVGHSYNVCRELGNFGVEHFCRELAMSGVRHGCNYCRELGNLGVEHFCRECAMSGVRHGFNYCR